MAKKDEIIAALHSHQVLVITGETGSGKTTQLPKMCLAAGLGRFGLIGCTQPRRVAAVSVAARVAEELGGQGAEIVGHKIRFADRTGRRTRIKFMTDGILLAETHADPLLRAYDTLIIDEAHERSLNIDFLLGILKNLLPRRPDLKIIITSATIDTEKFSRAFANAPIIEVSGRSYPVEVWCRPLAEVLAAEEEVTYIDQAVDAVLELRRLDRKGDILVFMPTERDIVETMEALADLRFKDAILMPLFGRQTVADQGRVFAPAPGQKIVVATNVAETSITVPGVRYVVDAGLARISQYNVRARTYSLPVSPISRASADQRLGRCGRVAPGICVRLYSQEDYDNRPQFTLPEIMRANLAEVVLRMLYWGLGDPATFPFVDPPHPRAIKDGFAILFELGAIDEAKRLTPRGRLMARLPLDPMISRMLVEGRENNALRETTIIAAALSTQDPRERPIDREKEADAMHARFADPQSDFLSLLKIWDTYHLTWEQIKSQGKMRKFCKSHFLSYNRMREWRDIHEQICLVLAEQDGFVQNTEDPGYDAIHRAVVSGHLRNIAAKKEKNFYTGAHGKKIMVFPGSGQFNKAGAWIVAAELVETTRLYARTVATIKPEWLEPLAGPLCRSTWSEPHWEKDRGQVVALEKVTLFGLVLVPGRKIHYGRINAQEARQIFIQSALVEGEIRGHYDFLAHNQRLVAEIEAMEDRIRRRDLLVDDRILFSFYDERLPDLCQQAALNRIIKERGSDDFLKMTIEDILRHAPGAEHLALFPVELRIRDIGLKLSYSFAPGTEEDGVSVYLPVDLKGDIGPEVFEWLVPGLLQEKITFLCKGLPKALRKYLVPIPEAVALLQARLIPYEGSLYSALARHLGAFYKVRIEPEHWPLETLPDHLRMRICVLDRQGKEVLATRRPADLVGLSVPMGIDRRLLALKKTWERQGLAPETFPDLPERISLPAASDLPSGFAYPGLAAEHDGTVAVRLFPTDKERTEASREGLLQLYSQAFKNELKVLKKELAIGRTNWPLYAGLGDHDGINRDLVRFVLLDIFACGSGILPSRVQLHKTIKAHREGGLFAKGLELKALVREVLAERKATLDLIGKFEAMAIPAGRQRLLECRHWCEQVVPVDFLRTMSRLRLAKAPRSLKAIRIRAERAHVSPAKDEAKAMQVRVHEERLQEVMEGIGTRSARQGKCMAEYAEMVEEFRISLFAPEIKAAFPVSGKRLEEKWQELHGV